MRIYLNSSRVVSVVEGEESEDGAGGRRRMLKASQSSSLQKARVTEYRGRAATQDIDSVCVCVCVEGSPAGPW